MSELKKTFSEDAEQKAVEQLKEIFDAPVSEREQSLALIDLFTTVKEQENKINETYTKNLDEFLGALDDIGKQQKALDTVKKNLEKHSRATRTL